MGSGQIKGIQVKKNMIFKHRDKTAKNEYSIESRFRNLNIVFFIVMAIILILVINSIFDNITETSSKDYARFYSTEAVNILNVYLNRETALATKVARSNPLIVWFADEMNMAKKATAYKEMISYADMLFNANLYFVINASLNEYSIDKDASFKKFVPFDVIRPDVEYDQWYYRCITSKNDYTLNIDIDKVTNQRRLWINHKVLHDGKLLGVFCSSLLFDAVIDEMFQQYDINNVRGIVINEMGIIQMDSTLMGEGDLQLYEEGLRIQDVNDDPVLLSYIDEYLAKIEGYFTSQDKPILFELKKGDYSFVSVAPIANTSWTVVTFFNPDSLFSVAKLRPLLFVMLAVLIAYSFFIRLLSRNLIFVPFQKLIGSLDQNGINKNGSVYGYDLKNEFGEVARTIQNVRDRLAIQNKELHLAMENAKQANQAKSVFLSNISHEMRTPMNAVVGLTDLMLEEKNPTVNLKENLQKISTAGNTLLELINDVLDISKIEAGKLELTPVQYEIPSLLNDLITLNMIRINDKPITFRLDISEELPCCLYGDDLRVKQIINNLLSNAFKYTQKGTVTLGISCEHGAGEDVWMSAYVSDTGIGIREEDLKKLFTDYNQLDAQANRSIEGTGLGLSITKMLVEHMNGEIPVESEYGKGTTFRFKILQRFVSDNAIGLETVENLRSFRYLDTRKRAHEKLVRPDLSYAAALVVDDMPTNLDVVTGMLKKYKMRVDCVTNGQDAVNLIEKGEPVYDVIFMDHMMPEMDGVEAIGKIRKIGTEYAMTVPVIALTANAIAGNEQMFLSNDFQDFLAKPINIMNLDSIVQRWIRDASRKDKSKE